MLYLPISISSYTTLTTLVLYGMQSDSALNNNTSITHSSIATNITSIQQTPKRRLVETSPTDMGNVVNMDANALMEMMHGSIAKLLDEKLKNLPTKDDLDEVKTEVKLFTSKIDEISKENQMLRERVRVLEQDKSKDHATIVRLEEHMKRKNIVIRGVSKEKSMYEAVNKIVTERLKINTQIEIEKVRKLYENEEKMSLMVVLKTERMVQEIMKHTTNLKGTAITIEHDLGSERLLDKKVMMQLKKDILFISKAQRVSVRNDKLKIENKWFKWNKNKELVCNFQKAEDVLMTLYGDLISCLDLKYDNILTKLNSKN